LRKRIALIVAALLLLGVGAGIAYASIPGPDGVIHGCYKTSNPAQGSVIVIDSAASCPSGFAALNWNQTGPQGLPGLAGVHVVEVPSFEYTGLIRCPTGETALSLAFTFPGAGPVAVNWRPDRGDGQPVPPGQAPVGYAYTTNQSYEPTGYLTCAVTS
jgi:hypothetical protein